jgi:hypothetical protein
MNGFKVGDKVEITGPASDGYSGFIGLPSVVAGFGPDSEVRVRLPNCASTVGFPQSSLRLMARVILAPGVRVRLPGKLVSYPGETDTTIKAVYSADKWEGGALDQPGAVYLLASGAYATPDELEVLPDPEPQPAEVWRHNRTGDRYVVIEVGKQKEADEWHAAVMYRPQKERQMYSRRLESFLESFTRS